jgi:hypothetical protein
MNFTVGRWRVFINIYFQFFYCPKISFRRTAVFVKGFRSLWLSGQVPGQNLETNHDSFVLHAFLFIIH